LNQLEAGLIMVRAIKSICELSLPLTLSRLGTSLVRHLALPVHISSNNGLMDMIGSGKVFTDVLAMRFNT
jgi:hypothetical protein